MEERKCSHFFLYFCPALFVVFNSLVHPYWGRVGRFFCLGERSRMTVCSVWIPYG
jgi:hypothetical protein